jgi:cytochrome P450
VISRLCATEGVCDLEAATLSMQLLFAGHETTVVAIGLGTLLLLTNRDQWQALLDDHALIPHAVEELLRASPPGGLGIPRYARTDLDIAGVTIRAGDLVLLDIGSANHDPAAFENPDHLDVTRKETVHVTFGYGPRYCLGAALARMELKAVFAQLIPRFPAMRLAVDPATLAVRSDALANGLVGLPVLW